MQDGNDIVNFEQQRCLVIISNADAVNDNSNHIPCGIESLDLSVIPDIDNATFLGGSHCNGIISLTEISGSSNNNVILYNPSLREFKILPGCVVNGFSLRAEGFGYDSRANDYKFVRILNSFVTYECIAMVYNMISDSWRRIKIDIEGIINVTHRGRVYCKGIYYWWVLNRLDFNDVILSFDMSSEEFDIIPLPENVQEVDESSKILAVWNESVVLLLCRQRTRVPLSFEIWSMNDCFGGVKGPSSWTTLRTVGPLVGINIPIAFWTSNELLMRSQDGRLVSYNLGTQKLRNLPIHGVLPGSCFADFYSESLVSVKRINKLN